MIPWGVVGSAAALQRIIHHFPKLLSTPVCSIRFSAEQKPGSLRPSEKLCSDLTRPTLDISSFLTQHQS